MLDAALLAALLLPDPPASAVPPTAPGPSVTASPADGWALWQHHCLECHRAGGSAPLRLDARGPIARKAATIATVLRERFMPPWLPTGGGPFAHDLPTDAERDAIAAWARAGALDAPETAAPMPDQGAGAAWSRVAAGWQVPADGTFMRTFAECGLPIDAALRAGGVRGVRMRRASGAVERAMLGLDRSGTLVRLDADDPGPGAYVHADAPGAPAGSLAVLGVDGRFTLPDGWVLPAAAPDADGRVPTLAVELHAVGRGAPMDGSVEFACIPAVAAPGTQLRTAVTFRCGPDGALRVERGDRTTHTVSGPLVRAADVGVIALRTDTRCIQARVVARAPDGTARVLLEIARYREGLDRAYRLDPPVRMAAGTVVELHTGHADDNALANSQPMALLWCLADGAAPAFPAAGTARATAPEPAPAGDLPPDAADGITWFDAVAACNARSVREGLSQAYRMTNPDRVDGHVVRAQVERVPDAAGWRLPRAADVARDPAAQGWWWTDDESGLSAFVIIEPSTARVDSLAPNLRISVVRAGMTRPVVASPGNQGHDSPSR